MKLKQGFIYHDTGNEAVLVPVGGAGFSGVVRGNQTLGAILALLQEETTETEITDALCERFSAPRETIAADVAKVLGELRKIGAIHE